MAGASNLFLMMIGSSIVLVCVVLVTISLIYRMTRKRHAVHQVERMQSKSHDVNEVVSPLAYGVSNDVGALEMCDNRNQHANDVDNNGDETGQSEGSNADVNQFMTSTGGSPNIAPDEFVVVGD
eukprot:524857_1